MAGGCSGGWLGLPVLATNLWGTGHNTRNNHTTQNSHAAQNSHATRNSHAAKTSHAIKTSHVTIFWLPESPQQLIREDREPGTRQLPLQPSLRSTGHLHAAHAVAEAISPEAGHVVLLDFHLVALEVSRLVEGDFVVLSLLGKTRGKVLGSVAKALELCCSEALSTQPCADPTRLSAPQHSPF